MPEEAKKSKALTIQLLIVVLAFIFIGAFAIDKAFPTAKVPEGKGTVPIVGFVPIEIKSQQIDITAEKPSAFVMFSEKEEPFDITSFRISGEVEGDGRAEILLDNGLGQELLIYSNIKQKKGNMITGMAVGSQSEPLPENAEIEEVEKDKAWFKISSNATEIDEKPAIDTGSGTEASQGKFKHACSDTCYMNMKMKEGLYYTLKVRVDPGTKVNINELKYTLEV